MLISNYYLVIWFSAALLKYLWRVKADMQKLWQTALFIYFALLKLLQICWNLIQMFGGNISLENVGYIPVWQLQMEPCPQQAHSMSVVVFQLSPDLSIY